MPAASAIASRIVKSPLGDLYLRVVQNELSLLSFSPGQDFAVIPEKCAMLDECEAELHEFFQGRRRDFSVRLAPNGTDFQKKVWEELCRIPFAETISYAELAKRAGSANGFRAVGAANGANPIAIVVPCHRVINSNGDMGGYGGGLWRKRWLLEHERRVAGMPPLDLFAVKTSVSASSRVP